MKQVRIGSQLVNLGERIGKGGEGDVFKHGENDSIAIKVYKEQLRNKRKGKVMAMVQANIASTTKLVAFPQEIVSGTKGNFVGFTMRIILDYRPIHELYSAKSRRVHFPKADYRFLIRAASNVARAIAQVHRNGCVIGDLNHSGILVAKDATVALIDADSFQYKKNNNLYYCLVGVPDFTPPELHGKKLSDIIREKSHDHFGLAVAIFQLLMMGRHPYSGIYKKKDLSLSQAIEENRFAYSKKRRHETQTMPPKGGLSLDDLPQEIATAFENAFGKESNHRPSASDWITLLGYLEKSLSRCSSVKSHYYPSIARSCVWCRLSQQIHYDYFPDSFVTTPSKSFHHIDVSKIINTARNFKLPNVQSLVPRIDFGKLRRSEAVSSAERSVLVNKSGGLVLLGIAVVLGISIPQAWWVALLIGGWGISILNSELDSTPIQSEYYESDKQAQMALNAYARRVGISEALALHEDFLAAISEYKNLGKDEQKELKNLERSRRSRQLSAFLNKHFIRNASIPSIGPAKTATLISFGVETAEDIEKYRIVSIPGFGIVTAEKLIHWRQTIERKFKYRTAHTAADRQAEADVRNRLNLRCIDLEKQIKNSYSALMNLDQKLRNLIRNNHVEPAFAKALTRRAQAVVDMEAIKLSTTTFVPKLVLEPRKPMQSSQSANTQKQNLRQPQPKTSPGVTNQTGHTGSNIPNCPSCGLKMVKRTARRGANKGGQFWGCSKFPHCTGIRNIP